ncbi:MAG: hypothetical protein JNG84_02060 [Archangium sp.]|nr:hypothetical protein [Archangium sp.]
MRIHTAALVLSAAVSSATAFAAEQPPRRVYVVAAAGGMAASPERQALLADFEEQLRAELRRRGATVVERAVAYGTIVLRPTLTIAPHGLTLKLVGLRASDRQLLGAVSLKAAGSNRGALLRAMVARACNEAELLDEGRTHPG